VLIFVAPRSQTFAIVGDIGVHSRCGESFWSELAEQVQRHFSTDQYTDAIVGAITRAADLLAGHFPRCADDRNELSDAVARPTDLV
jgi:uncharacterized membrane protein